MGAQFLHLACQGEVHAFVLRQSRHCCKPVLYPFTVQE